ncbi:MAG: T9SS type A sorting domain-containing protein [Bacteroidota bacterium]|nr:T9SS type A sorting domain-containing protein [Bacteroidota bacterium]
MKTNTLYFVFFYLFVFESLTAQNWQKVNSSYPFDDTSVTFIDYFFLDSNNGLCVSNGKNEDAIFKTSNGGQTWNKLLVIANNNGNGKLFALDSLHYWLLKEYGGIYSTSDGGSKWDSVRIISPSPNWLKLPFLQIHFFNKDEGIVIDNYRWLTTDGGKMWTRALDTSLQLLAKDLIFTTRTIGWFVSNGNEHAPDAGTLAKTTDGGLTWKNAFSTFPNPLYTIDFYDTLHGMIISNGVFSYSSYALITTDGGINWQGGSVTNNGRTNDIGLNPQGLAITAADYGEIYLSKNFGTSWNKTVIDTVYDFKKVQVLKKENIAYIIGQNFYDKTSTLFKADLHGVVNVAEQSDQTITGFEVTQNYPNPFNPNTMINYALPKAGNVVLKIFDALGREVATLVNEFKSEGTYNVPFNGSSLSSGIYFYRLQAGRYVETKKLVLMK